MINWFKFSVGAPVTFHIHCILYRHVYGSFVGLLHSLLPEGMRSILKSAVANDSPEVFEFEHVDPDCCLCVVSQPGDRDYVNEFPSNGMAGGPLSDRSWDKRWAFTTSTNGKARGPSRSKPHGESGASEGNSRPVVTVLSGILCRSCGRATAEKVMLEALKVVHAKEAEI